MIPLEVDASVVFALNMPFVEADFILSTDKLISDECSMIHKHTLTFDCCLKDIASQCTRWSVFFLLAVKLS